MGSATATVAFFRSLGGAVGVAALGAVLAHRVQDEIASGLADLGTALPADQASGSVPRIDELPLPARGVSSTRTPQGSPTCSSPRSRSRVVALVAIVFLREVPLGEKTGLQQRAEVEADLTVGDLAVQVHRRWPGHRGWHRSASAPSVAPMSDDTTATRAAELLRLHTDPELLQVVNVWDAITAKVVTDVPGTTALATASHSIAATLGYADGENIPVAEMIDMCGRIVAATHLPVSADLEAGYGDPGDTIRRAIAVGVVGANLEDQMKPLDQAVAAVAAVVAAGEAEGVPFVLNARTDAFLRGADRDPAEVLADAIERGKAFLDAGAACVFVPGKLDLDTIGALVEAFGERRLSTIGVRGTPSPADQQAARCRADLLRAVDAAGGAHRARRPHRRPARRRRAAGGHPPAELSPIGRDQTAQESPSHDSASGAPASTVTGLRSAHAWSRTRATCSVGCAPETPNFPSRTKNGTPVMPNARACCSSARTSAA